MSLERPFPSKLREEQLTEVLQEDTGWINGLGQKALDQRGKAPKIHSPSLLTTTIPLSPTSPQFLPMKLIFPSYPIPSDQEFYLMTRISVFGMLTLIFTKEQFLYLPKLDFHSSAGVAFYHKLFSKLEIPNHRDLATRRFSFDCKLQSSSS